MFWLFGEWQHYVMKSLNQCITKLSDNHWFIFFNIRFASYSINPFDEYLNFSVFMYPSLSSFESLSIWIRKWLNLHFDKWLHIASIGSHCPVQTTVRYRVKGVTLHPNSEDALGVWKVFSQSDKRRIFVSSKTQQDIFSVTRIILSNWKHLHRRGQNYPPQSDNFGVP